MSSITIFFIIIQSAGISKGNYIKRKEFCVAVLEKMGWKLVENEDGTKVWTEIFEEEGDEMEEDVQKKEDVVLQQMCMTDQSTIHVCAGPSGKTEVNILNTLYFVKRSSSMSNFIRIP